MDTENDIHKISLKEVYSRLESTQDGLSSAEVKKRHAEYGYNILEEKKKLPLIIRFGKHFINYFAILLWVGSILSFIASFYKGDESYLYIGIALGGVVILNAIFMFIQEYRSEKIMESFKKMLPVKIECLRDGEKKEILAKNLVPGDIIFLAEGDRVPADGRLIEENVLKVDNSSLTGESEPQLRKLECTHDNILESRNMVFSGTLVQSGNGVAIICKTGMNTQIGKIVKLTKATKAVATPLGKEIKRFINIISGIAIFLGITFFLVSLLIGNKPIASLIFMIGIIVANVPEGLLPTVTLALSIAARKMARKKALIKNLESVETLGSTTVICTDKTGTLTEGKIAVNSIFINLEQKNVTEKKSCGLKWF
jgi:sodium/potassium-transporting ATPase subunit alpha